MTSILAFLLSLMSSIAIAAPVKAQPRVLMVINEGFYAPEHTIPKAEFLRAGFTVTIAAKKIGPVHPDERNNDSAPVHAEIPFSAVKVVDYDAVVFAGGNGAWTDYFPNEDAHRILREFLASGKITALICSSTGLLGVTANFDGNSPLTAGRKVTGYYRVRGILEKMGLVKYDPGVEGKPHVVVDGSLITGRDPLSSEFFAKTVASEVKKSLSK